MPVPTLLLLSPGEPEETPSGATVIHDNWRHGTPDLVNLTDIPIDKIRPEKYRCVLIIGQGAIKEMLLANNASAILSGKTVGLYTHLIDQNTLRLLRQLQNKVRFNLFFTRSQITLLKLRNISEYNFLSSKVNNVWGQDSLAIETVAPDRGNIPEKNASPQNNRLCDLAGWKLYYLLWYAAYLHKRSDCCSPETTT